MPGGCSKCLGVGAGGWIEDRAGAVGVLVNNAGYGQSGAVEAVALDDVRAQFDTNLLGYVRMAQLVLPGMRRQSWGRVINVSSVAGRVVMPGSGIYSASKFAIEAMSDALRFEVKGFGVDVSLIEPGPIRTDFTQAADAAFPDPGACEGVYASYHRTVATADAETDTSRLAGSSEAVAQAIERAITTHRPRPRYPVTPVARLLPALRAALPTRVWDAFLASQTQPPAPA
jgi:short-subunit dehydrogenase